MSDRTVDHEAWSARAALLALLGASLGLAWDLILSEGQGRWSEDPLRLGAASFLVVGGIAFAFTLERVRWLWSLLFGLGCGFVIASVFYWNGSPSGWTEGDEWRVISAILAVAIAAPLFQTARDHGRWNVPPDQAHAHAWTNIVLWGAVCAFSLLSFLLGHLLAELFHLIGINLLRDAMRESWFVLALVGAAYGAATGLLRDRDKVLGGLQRVAMIVLSVLAPFLAAGLGLFVLALPITGLAPLWDKTSATTPILLLAIAGAFILANAVIGNAPEEEAKGRVLRASAMVLAAVMAPLAAVAAVSTWLRIDQHGFTPERLWALVFVGVVLGISLTYLWVLVSGRGSWTERARPANVRLAIGICAVALLLATPLFNFGAIASRDQLSRLQSGKVSVWEFDWAAMRFDFGPSGVEALRRLAATGPAEQRRRAAEWLQRKTRWFTTDTTSTHMGGDPSGTQRLIVAPGATIPEGLRQAIAQSSPCSTQCRLIYDTPKRAVVLGSTCPGCEPFVHVYLARPDGSWASAVTTAPVREPASAHRPAGTESEPEALGDRAVEVRTVTKRQVYLDGEPIGPVFDP